PGYAVTVAGLRAGDGEHGRQVLKAVGSGRGRRGGGGPVRRGVRSPGSATTYSRGGGGASRKPGAPAPWRLFVPQGNCSSSPRWAMLSGRRSQPGGEYRITGSSGWAGGQGQVSQVGQVCQ